MKFNEGEVLRILPDPVINDLFFSSEKISKTKPALFCAHCHKPIKGKAYRVGDKYYDEYCYSLRFVLDF